MPLFAAGVGAGPVAGAPEGAGAQAARTETPPRARPRLAAVRSRARRVITAYTINRLIGRQYRSRPAPHAVPLTSRSAEGPEVSRESPGKRRPAVSGDVLRHEYGEDHKRRKRKNDVKYVVDRQKRQLVEADLAG